MRDKILEIVVNHPKHYTRIIKSDNKLYNWVLSNKKTNSEKLSAQIYSAVYSITDKCEFDNIRKFDRWSTGFIGCGPAARCECTRNRISRTSSISKQNISQEEKAKINEKRKITMLDKYGVEYNSQRPEIKPILKKQRMNTETYDFLHDYEWMYKEYIENKRTSVDIAVELGIHNSTVIEYLRRFGFDIRKTSNYSLCEKQIKEFIESFGITVSENDRTVLNGKELDLLIPEKNIAIEINGLYWHSVGKNDKPNKNYHLEKKKQCLEQCINLLHITDYEWNNKTDIIKSMIQSKLGVTERIYARKCNIVGLTNNQAQYFFDKNHLNGFINTTTYIGLEYNNSIVMCMSFDENFMGNAIKLQQMATILNTTIVGGMSKILKYYMKNYKFDKLYSRCDFSYSDGNVYKQNGFNLINISEPDYFWTDGNTIISKDTAQIKNIVGEKYDENLDECDNMLNAGYRRYWNCGDLIFEYWV